MFESMMQIFTPILVAVTTIISPLAVAALVKLFQKWGLDIEAQHRDALQSALHNAAMIAVGKMTGMVDPTKPLGNQLAAVPVNMAVDYVQKSVPDAVGKFGLDQNRIIDLLQPHLVDAITRKIR